MQDGMNTVTDFGNVREAVCVSTEKIMDACRDQDCMEDVSVYLTRESQETLECATSVKARLAELLYADVCVEPMGYQEGYYCVSIQYYYRIIADAVVCAVRPVTIYGLATVNKRVTLFGGQEGARIFTSQGAESSTENPLAVLEALDPVILQAKIVDVCTCRRPPCCCQNESLPGAVAAAFDDELVLSGMNRLLTVTLGQFSIVRLERKTQLLIPSYDYCMPEKKCSDEDCGNLENPCETFARMQFPVQAFFPQSSEAALCDRTSCQRKPSCNTCACGTTAPAAVEQSETEDCGCHSETAAISARPQSLATTGNHHR